MRADLDGGHDLRYTKNRTKCDLHKFCLTNRVVNIWNSLGLPSYVVGLSATSRPTKLNSFKSRLDKFWHNQDMID